LPVFVCLSVCLSVCVSVCLLARLLQNACMDLDKMLTDVGTMGQYRGHGPTD